MLKKTTTQLPKDKIKPEFILSDLEEKIKKIVIDGNNLFFINNSIR